MSPDEEKIIKRYAFIDVSNTKSTTKMSLGFSIDWEKLYTLLSGEKWQCKKVFYYEGSMDDERYKTRHTKLSKIGYVLKTKPIFLHKIKEKMARFVCNSCTKENEMPVAEGKFSCVHCSTMNVRNIVPATHNPKANFDVELTVDTLEYAASDTEILLFTGDGDFRYLAEKLLEKGSVVTFVSTGKKSADGVWRFSTRLKDLIAGEEVRVKVTGSKIKIRLIEINNWKNLIIKAKKA